VHFPGSISLTRFSVFIGFDNQTDDAVIIPTIQFEFHHITDENAKVDVGKVLGEIPETKDDIAAAIISPSNPSESLVPIIVDSSGRIEISGVNNNTLDDIADANGRVDVSKFDGEEIQLDSVCNVPFVKSIK
jgi:hypothetical protein